MEDMFAWQLATQSGVREVTEADGTLQIGHRSTRSVDRTITALQIGALDHPKGIGPQRVDLKATESITPPQGRRSFVKLLHLPSHSKRFLLLLLDAHRRAYDTQTCCEHKRHTDH